MADWNKPALTDSYVNFLAYFKALATDLAKGNDPAKTTITNPFADMIRWNSAAGRWEIFNGTTWGPLASSYDINVTTLGGKAANLYALLKSPIFTDSPQCPTADVAANNQLLANTAFVQLIKAGMIDGAPANLNTLSKLAASLGNDPAFATTYNTAWSTHLAAADPHSQYVLDSDLATHAGVAATTTVVGHTRLATNTETTTGTATNIATHPAGVAAAIAAAMSSVSGGGGISVFTANGTFTVPSGVTKIYVTGCGAGGNGGAGGTSYAGAGGGGGGGCISYPLVVTSGQQLAITIGQSSGASTSIGGLLTLGGGGTGSIGSAANVSGGLGGTGPITGGAGSSNANFSIGQGGGAGGAAAGGGSGDGSQGSSNFYVTFNGFGGPFGAGGNGKTSYKNGTGYGSGGAGGNSASGAGGSFTQGFLRIEW